jgi:membrane-associated HD superfamily phosphohydrolase
MFFKDGSRASSKKEKLAPLQHKLPKQMEVAEQYRALRSQQALESLGLSNEAVSNVALSTWALLFGSIILFVVINIIVIQANENLSKTTLIVYMSIDVLAMVLFAIGFLLLSSEVGQYIAFHTKFVL